MTDDADATAGNLTGDEPTIGPPDERRVLLLEDDLSVIKWAARVLEDMGATVRVATTLAEARLVLRTEPIGLALVDLELPDGRGTTLVREIREAGRVPLVIVFSAHAHDDAVVEGLAAGADDYVSKPVAASVLRARIDAVRRRHRHPLRLSRGSVTLHLDSRRLEGPHGTASLTRKEADLLQVLLASTPALVPREVLLKEVWGYDFDPGTSVLDVTLTRVRAKLAQVAHDARIASQRERGVQVLV
ncbi:MAG: response regulator transcription factor [Gemmatimonadetes bacterium]|nr:response regulator transcription factor [Gemmatimonadota bacterium]